MTVQQLISLLQYEDPDMEVLFATERTGYAYDVTSVRNDLGIAAFHGSDYPAVIVYCPHQDGAVISRSDIE